MLSDQPLPALAIRSLGNFCLGLNLWWKRFVFLWKVGLRNWYIINFEIDNINLLTLPCFYINVNWIVLMIKILIIFSFYINVTWIFLMIKILVILSFLIWDSWIFLMIKILVILSFFITRLTRWIDRVKFPLIFRST